MPNWIQTHVTAHEHVIKAMTNDNGFVDFNKIVSFSGPNNDWDGIIGDAEQAAEIVCKFPLSGHPLLAAIQSASRDQFDIKALSEESFKQFVGMLENYRACGYLHNMDFNRKAWGTKWNARESKVDAGKASFDTPWSCPKPVLIALSNMFPSDEITVSYADEDIGSNCGTFTLLGGVITQSDIAPAWRDQSDAEKEKWKAFACNLTDRDLADYLSVD